MIMYGNLAPNVPSDIASLAITQWHDCGGYM